MEEFEKTEASALDLNIPIVEPPDLELPSLESMSDPTSETIPTPEAEQSTPPALEDLEPIAQSEPSFEDHSSVDASTPTEEFPMSSTGVNDPAPAIDAEGLSNAAFNVASAGFAFDVDTSLDHVPAPEQNLATADSSFSPDTQPTQSVTDAATPHPKSLRLRLSPQRNLQPRDPPNRWFPSRPMPKISIPPPHSVTSAAASSISTTFSAACRLSCPISRRRRRTSGALPSI